ncbi:PDZ domain-containing protein [candidate division KSB1 bacterium]|nr:PDZ domain-containing protein [candidate division KSB1 bacterium]
MSRQSLGLKYKLCTFKTMKRVIPPLFVLLISFTYTFAETPTIEYYLELDESTWEAANVQIYIEPIRTSHLTFYMPAWRPGAYVRQDFGQYIRDVRAFRGTGQAISVIQLNTNLWRIETEDAAALRIEYSIDHSQPRLMPCAIDSSHAIIDGAMNFMGIEQFRDVPVTVRFQVPDGWQIVIGLPPTRNTDEFKADNYTQLIDTPALMGTFHKYYFKLKDQPIDVIFTRPVAFNVNTFLLQLKRIVTYQSQLFNDIPFDRYYFLINVLSSGRNGGGLEHNNSTELYFPESMLQYQTTTAVNIAAHEFFHLWNVKRIVPFSLKASDLLHEPRTSSLWFCEGLTSYYADISMVRTKIWAPEDFLSHQAEIIERMTGNTDRLETTLEAASYSAWEKGYYHQGISYYDKGQLASMLLDLTIRQRTENRRSLDDVLTHMNRWFAQTNTGYNDDDILRSVNSVTNQDFSDFFDMYIRGLIPLPYKDVFGYAGVMANVHPDTVGDLGFIQLDSDKSTTISRIDEMGAPAKAGLRKGDRLIGINDRMISSSAQLTEIIESLSPGSEARIQTERDNIPLTLRCRVESREKVTAELSFQSDASPKQLRIRQSWLTGIVQ